MIKTIEELSINAWPALQTMVYDGWILRFSNGYTKRANGIYPLYESKDELDTKIAACERVYQEQGLDVVYKMTSDVQPKELDAALAAKGYAASGYTSIQTLSLDHVRNPSTEDVIIHEGLTSQWLHNFCRLNSVREEHQSTMSQMLNNILPKACFISITKDQNTVACGLGVRVGDYVGLFDIVTDVQFRRQGIGEQLVLHLLKWGKRNGAKRAFLQVVLDNTPALHLYNKIGFEERYQYWYRIKISK
jgi:N-acetylglutamate synthase